MMIPAHDSQEAHDSDSDLSALLSLSSGLDNDSFPDDDGSHSDGSDSDGALGGSLGSGDEEEGWEGWEDDV
jgi:hypothetical protein